MKKLLILFLSLSFILSLFSLQSSARPRRSMPRHKKARIEARVHKLEAQERQDHLINLRHKLGRLQQRVHSARRKERIQGEIERVEVEIEILEGIIHEPPPPPIMERRGPIAPTRTMPRSKQKQRKNQGPQLDLSAGYLGGIPAALVGLRYSEPFDLVATSLRLSGAYAQETTRKYALVIVDGIYHLNPPQTKGVRSYVGLGANFVAYTSGQRTGTVCGHAYYGVEGGRFQGGKMFFELGYGSIRTGFSPSITGPTALLGVRL